MPETFRYSDVTSRLGALERSVTDWQKRHEEEDDRKFGELGAAVNSVNAKAGELLQARAEQVGAAKAIAELAESRAKRNTFVLALVVGVPSLLTFLSQHHWLGF